MFQLIVYTLLFCLLVVFIYDQVMYQLYVRSVRKGVIGKLRKYRTPSILFQFIRNTVFVCKFLFNRKES